MAQIHVITFTSIHDFFKNHGAQLKKGENSYNSGYVTKFVYDSSVTPPVIHGNVMASMKKRTYLVEMILNQDSSISRMSCRCPRGEEICHHMAAFALHCHYNISVTDKSCSWTKKTSELDKIKKIKDIYAPKKPFTATKRQASNDEIEQFKNSLTDCHVVGFTWLLRKDSLVDFLTIVPSIEDIVFSKEYIEAVDKIKYFIQNSRVNPDQIASVERATVGQSANEKWLVIRKHRLTASRFGVVLRGIRINKFPPSLFKNLLGIYNIDKVLAVQWGRENEKLALESFEAATGLKVERSGLWLDECGFIGASPDGLIGDEAILEIKCPYKFRNTPLNEAFQDKQYIIYEENDIDFVNPNHIYYDQIQGQLYLTKRKICYLIIWTPNENRIYSIEKNEDWQENLELLKSFYVHKFISYISNNE